jgi:two-component system, chemotaxis family, sensor kinase CheA
MDDQNKFASIYAQEAEELLREIEETVLLIEETPDDAEAVNSLFRAFHTIKGSGAMFGFNDVAEFTHHVETALDRVRAGALPISKELIDLILKSKDHIHSIISCKQTGGQADRETGDSIIPNLHKLLHGVKIPANDPCPEKMPLDFKNAGENPETTYRIRFTPDREIFASGTDPSLLLEELNDLGECKITPMLKDIPLINELDAEKCYLAWDIILTTRRDINAIKDVFIFVEDRCRIKIDAVYDGNENNDEAEIKKLGEILIDRKEVSFKEINEALQKQKRIGELLVESRLVDQQTVDAALFEQQHINKVREKRLEDGRTSSIRVSAEKLDLLMDLVGELVTTQARLSQFSMNQENQELVSIAEEVERLTSELRDNAMSIRMMPVGTTFNNFKRLVRDLSAELGKEIELKIEGAETELDKTVIERLGDPLMHLIRNSIDHGIETPEKRVEAGKPGKGTILLKAEHKGAYVVITVKDDGEGLNVDAIRAKAMEKGLISKDDDISEREVFDLIFAPGFSTAGTVSNVSGRGVGMDVVKKTVDALRGTIAIKSEKSSGASIMIKLPLTLAIVEGLLVKVGDNQFVLPLSAVEECVELSRADNHKNNGRNIANIRGEIVPYIRLRSEFEIQGEPPALEQIVVTSLNGNRVGFVVDKVIGEHQTVIKNLGKLFKDVNGVSGASILGDGRVALIIDIRKLVEDRETIDCKMHNYN